MKIPRSIKNLDLRPVPKPDYWINWPINSRDWPYSKHSTKV